MSIFPKIIDFAERAPLPDFVLGAGINLLVKSQKDRLKSDQYLDANFVKEMANFPIAINTKDANDQHYELPSKFFELVLGKHKKYSCCFYENGTENLDEAEEKALKLTAQRAELKDGMRILELGCGWGSLSLYMAARFPNSKITAISNSHSQRQYIESQKAKRGIENLEIITCDMNDLDLAENFDRIVSIEMFEHMSNWHDLLKKSKTWLKPKGKMFIHIFTHKSHSYRFDVNDKNDWIGKYFFSGGIMPSQNLLHALGEIFEVENSWQINGTHYQKTALHWLRNCDENKAEIMNIFQNFYGDEKQIWLRRWRLFFLATAGLFGYDNGNEWGVSHYLLKPA